MDSDITKGTQAQQYSLRSVVMMAMGFFLVVMILTSLIVIPKINNEFESQNATNVSADLALEAELFSMYVESQRTILQDLSQFPSLVNAAMLSDSSNPVLIDLLENVVIGGQRGRLILQDIDGTILIQTASNLEGTYKEGDAWLDNILDNKAPYHFQLLNQKDDQFSFKISIPVKYNEFVEGVLSAEITAPLAQIFVAQSFDDRIAFKLIQGQTTIATNSDLIEIASEESLYLEQPNVSFVYITDEAIIKQKERTLRNTMLSVLFAGLAVSFLLFTLYGYRTQTTIEKPANSRFVLNHAYIIPVVLAVIGAAASIVSFFIIYNSQQGALEKEQIATGKNYIQRIEWHISRNLDKLNSLASFYAASNFVDRQEFDSFTESFITQNRNIQALAWVPKVSFDERSTYERQAQLDGLTNFDFKELSTQYKLQKAANRDQYFPVFYIAPLAGNEKVFGFDLSSNKQRLAALMKASSSGKMTATSPIELVEETEVRSGVLVFHPVYNKVKETIPTTNGDFGAVRGFVLLVLKTDDILSDSVKSDNAILSTYVQDITDSDKHEKLYGDVMQDDVVTFSQSIDVAGRTWQIDTIATTSLKTIPWTPWLALVSGLIVTALMTTGLIHLIRRREVVEQLVKQRTAELRMLSSIAANSNDIFLVIAAEQLDEPNGGREILYVNDAFVRFTGYSFDEAVGNTPRMLNGNKTDRDQLLAIRDALSEGKAYQGELINYTKTGREYWVDTNIVPLRNDTGKIIQFAVVQRDISDRVRAQVEREGLIDKLTDSNEELARFAYVCSHDLQEPLRMIRSFSEKLQAHIADDLVDDEKGQKYFRFITDGATRAQDLIADILSYSSIDSDTEILQSVEGNQLIDTIRDTMHVSLQNSGGTITRDTLPVIHGNRAQLYQLFQNIINNAIKYQKIGTPPSVHISAIDSEKYWQFSLRDNGIGIERRHQHKIFDVFQRLHRKSQYAGTGVGLSICKKVVERHGGTVWVDSELGTGTTFYFTLLKPVAMETTHERQRKAG